MATITQNGQSVERDFGESYDPGVGLSDLTLSAGHWNFTADFANETPTDDISINLTVDNAEPAIHEFLTSDTSLDFTALEGGAAVNIISYDSVPITITPVERPRQPVDNAESVPEPLTVLGTLAAAALGIVIKRRQNSVA